MQQRKVRVKDPCRKAASVQPSIKDIRQRNREWFDKIVGQVVFDLSVRPHQEAGR
jgi:hypothetical protein